MRVDAQKASPQVGYVFQKDTLFPWRTVADNIGYGMELAGVAKAERAERVATCLDQAGCANSPMPIPRRCRAACASAPR